MTIEQKIEHIDELWQQVLQLYEKVMDEQNKFMQAALYGAFAFLESTKRKYEEELKKGL